MVDTLAARVLRTLAKQPAASCLEIQQRMDYDYNINPVINRLVVAELAISTGWSKPAPGGKPRKLYAITNAGRELLATRKDPPPQAA